jgi:hypothetical protein
MFGIEPLSGETCGSRSSSSGLRRPGILCRHSRQIQSLRDALESHTLRQCTAESSRAMRVFSLPSVFRSAAIPRISARQTHAPIDTAPTASRFRRSPELRFRCRRILQSQSLTPGVEPQTVRSAHRRRIFARRLACGLLLLFSLPLNQSKKSPARRVPTEAGAACLGLHRTGEGIRRATRSNQSLSCLLPQVHDLAHCR